MRHQLILPQLLVMSSLIQGKSHGLSIVEQIGWEGTFQAQVQAHQQQQVQAHLQVRQVQAQAQRHQQVRVQVQVQQDNIWQVQIKK